MKHTIIFFAVLMMAVVLPKVASAYDFSAVSPSGHTIQYEIDYYHFSSTVAVVAGPSDDTTMVGDVIIPDSVQYGSQKYPVVYIKCFRARRISSLQIPNTVTHIQQDALSLCGFSTLTIPQNVMYLGGAIAMNCPNLTTVYFNAKNAKVRGNVLSYSDTNYYGRQFSWTLREIIFGDSVESIPKYICANADSLRTVIISPSVRTIGNGAFPYCDSLTSTITIGENVERIGNNAFAYCKALSTINYYSTKCKSRYDSDWDGPFCGAKTNQIIIGKDVQELDCYMFAQCTIQNNIISHAATPPHSTTQ